MRVKEALDLPLVFLDCLARIFEGVEKGGEWPEPLCYAPTDPIPKAGGSDDDGPTKKAPDHGRGTRS